MNSPEFGYFTTAWISLSPGGAPAGWNMNSSIPLHIASLPRYPLLNEEHLVFRTGNPKLFNCMLEVSYGESREKANT